MRSPVIRDIRLVGWTVARPGYFTVIGWCFECHRWHSHSGFKAEPVDGTHLHRYPHCGNDNYRLKLYDGYVIEIEGRAPPEVLADYKRKRPRGLKPRGWGEGENPVADRATRKHP